MVASRNGEWRRGIYCINPKAMGVVDTAIRNGGQASRVKCVSVRSDLPIDKQPESAAQRVFVRACARARVSKRVRAYVALITTAFDGAVRVRCWCCFVKQSFSIIFIYALYPRTVVSFFVSFSIRDRRICNTITIRFGKGLRRRTKTYGNTIG